jgi:predicted nuclease of predicted toxin-antitoxin system
MKLKLDENLDARLVSVLRQSGHDVATVREQGLMGIDDQALYAHCKSETRILVTLDLDFASILRYPPGTSSGIVVFRAPDDLRPTLRILMATLIGALVKASPAGQLWIVEPGRVRVHEPQSEQ